MKLTMHRVGSIVTMKASGTAEELAVFANLAGLIDDAERVIVPAGDDEGDDDAPDCPAAAAN